MLVAGVLALLAGCGSEPMTGSAGIDQGQFVASALTDREFLFDGYVVAVDDLSMPVDDTYVLNVRICGSRLTCVPASQVPDVLAKPSATPSSATPSSNPTSTPTATPTATATPEPPGPGEATVRVGGMIRTRLTSDMSGTITPIGTEVQPVLTPDDRATWEWKITPNKSGEYQLRLHITLLRADTDQPLITDQTIDIPLTVRQTAANTANQVYGGVKEMLTLLSAGWRERGRGARLVIRSVREASPEQGAGRTALTLSTDCRRWLPIGKRLP